MALTWCPSGVDMVSIMTTQESGVDMVSLMSDNGFYTPRRVLSCPYPPSKGTGGAGKKSAGGASKAGSNGGGAATAQGSASNGARAQAPQHDGGKEGAHANGAPAKDQVQNGHVDGAVLASAAASAVVSSGQSSSNGNGQGDRVGERGSPSKDAQQPLPVPRGGANFGKPLPLELPTAKEVRERARP